MYKIPKFFEGKHFSGHFDLVIEKYNHEKSFSKCYVKITNRVTQYCWKKVVYLRRISLYEKHFSWFFFWTTLLSVRVHRTDDRKEKLEFGENINSLNWVFPEKLDWFGMIHQWGYTRMKTKLKNMCQKEKFFQ